MPTRGSKDPNGRALRGRRAHTTFALLTDPARQIWNSFNNRANAGGADAPEAAVNGCLYDRFKSLYTKTATKPSLVIVPARFKSGTLYSQIPSSNADFTVTRALNTATRFDSSALIQTGITSGVPRLDYYTSGGVTGCPALLVEPAGTNLFARSNELNIGSPWTQDNISFTTGSTSAFTSPDGTTNAFLLADTSGNTRHRISQQPTTSFVSGTTYTVSIFVKKNSSNRFLLINAATAFGARAALNLDTLAITNIDGSGASIDNYGNGWYRFLVRGTATSTQATSVFIQMQNAATDTTYIGDGSSFYLFAAQLETGSVATSYIPTTAGTGSRSADVISVSGAVSGSIGQQSGTLYIECQSEFAVNDIIVINTAGQTPGTNYLSITKNSSNRFQAAFVASGTSVSFTETSGITSFAKIALAYASGNTACFINGIQVGTTSATGFSFNGALNNIRFVANLIEGAKTTRIRAVALYTTRLTNAELAFITQP